MTEPARKKMESLLNELVERVKAAAGSNLHSVVLYGSAASPEFHEKFSDMNVLCLLRDLSSASMLALSEAVAWWTKQKHPAPLLLSVEELKTSADVFPIEMLDMQQHHRMLYGEDVIATLEVPLRLHRIQMEHDLRTKLILLRQNFLTVAKEDGKLLALMIDSLSSFVTLFRHALIAMGEEPESGKRAMLQQLQRRTNIDVRSLLELLSVREGALKPDALDLKTIFKSYLATIEQVVSALDRL